jgi:hypothetical protein
MALIGSTGRRLGDLWLQLAVSACVLVAPPLFISVGLTYFGFPQTNAPEAVLTANSAVPTGTSLMEASAAANQTSVSEVRSSLANGTQSEASGWPCGDCRPACCRRGRPARELRAQLMLAKPIARLRGRHAHNRGAWDFGNGRRYHHL